MLPTLLKVPSTRRAAPVAVQKTASGREQKQTDNQTTRTTPPRKPAPMLGGKPSLSAPFVRHPHLFEHRGHRGRVRRGVHDELKTIGTHGVFRQGCGHGWHRKSGPEKVLNVKERIQEYNMAARIATGSLSPNLSMSGIVRFHVSALRSVCVRSGLSTHSAKSPPDVPCRTERSYGEGIDWQRVSH